MKLRNQLVRAVPISAMLLLLAGKVPTADTQVSDALRYLRTAIQVYAGEHKNTSPGYAALDEQLNAESDALASLSDELLIPKPSADSDIFVRQLTQFTDTLGHVQPDRTTVCDRGPYMIAIPANPITHKTSVLVVDRADMPPADESKPYGWIYNARTRRLIANLAGVDTAGVPYANY